MSVIQVIFSGIILFLLYHYLLKTIGIERMGIWSVVMGIASASRITELGLSGSVVKFVAKYIAHADLNSAAGVIQTAAISIGCFMVGILVIAYPLWVWVLELIVPPHAMQEAMAILPYALVSLWITIVALVFQSGLNGCQRVDLGSLIMISGRAFYLLLVVMLGRVCKLTMDPRHSSIRLFRKAASELLCKHALVPHLS